MSVRVIFRKTGSSPRARGTPLSLLPSSPPLRFIPAGAGNTRTRRYPDRPAAVHPRGRGEHDGRGRDSAYPPGSSPRARGTLDRAPTGEQGRRFIPAGAGNTLDWSANRLSGPVHPRGRGEHPRHGPWMTWADGSSPRARGTQRISGGNVGLARFIPAGAGNTERRMAPWSRMSVHPRGRGEHPLPSRPLSSSFGSSPRARGTHFLHLAENPMNFSRSKFYRK